MLIVITILICLHIIYIQLHARRTRRRVLEYVKVGFVLADEYTTSRALHRTHVASCLKSDKQLGKAAYAEWLKLDPFSPPAELGTLGSPSLIDGVEEKPLADLWNNKPTDGTDAAARNPLRRSRRRL